MSAVAEKKIDKSKWGDGPWQTEPDRKEWEHAGFPCLIVRVEHHGALCGYVAVPLGHPWHGKHYDAVDADVHGGLTYADKCQGSICHVPKPGGSDDVWWLGFDHGHCDDLSPGMNSRLSDLGLPDKDWEVYRDMDYATEGVNSLAEQAKAATT